MDLREYEGVKFELAEALRTVCEEMGQVAADGSEPVRNLLARLAEDRFNLVVVGRFSRGKTTLMNAVLGTDRLPTGALPLTSVITSVAYGSRERVQIESEGLAVGFDIPIEALPEYVTERGNPGNVRHIRGARVELPAEILRRGFYFIDTPGLGSAILENSRTTEAFLPQADAVILVSGYEGPLSEDEMQVARATQAAGRPLFLVLNKQDLPSSQARREVERYVRERLATLSPGRAPRIFSLSALMGLTAKMAGDAGGLAASGMVALEGALTRFLIEEKNRVLLAGIARRLAELIGAHESRSPVLRNRLADLIDRLCIRTSMGTEPVERLRGAVEPVALPVGAELPRMKQCVICARVRDALFDFLRNYQLEIARLQSARERLAQAGGLCGPHLWLYASIAADRDICLALTPLVKRVATALRDLVGLPDDTLGSSDSPELKETDANGPSRSVELALPSCIACAQQLEVETAALAALARQDDPHGRADVAGLPSLCLPHLRLIVRQGFPRSLARALVERQVGAAARLSEDMQRYALKRDGSRRGLSTEEEIEAAQRAVAFLAGARTLQRED